MCASELARLSHNSGDANHSSTSLVAHLEDLEPIRTAGGGNCCFFTSEYKYAFEKRPMTMMSATDNKRGATNSTGSITGFITVILQKEEHAHTQRHCAIDVNEKV